MIISEGFIEKSIIGAVEKSVLIQMLKGKNCHEKNIGTFEFEYIAILCKSRIESCKKNNLMCFGLKNTLTEIKKYLDKDRGKVVNIFELKNEEYRADVYIYMNKIVGCGIVFRDNEKIREIEKKLNEG